LGRIRQADLSAAERAEEIFTTHLMHPEQRGDWIVREGVVAYTAGIEARRFDMTIVGQVDPARPPLGIRGLVPEALFMESGRPVLIIPAAGEIASVGTRALVAWDGSREATRALNDAMPFLEKAEFVSVMTFERSARYADQMTADPMDVVRHLRQHGIDAKEVIRRLHKESVAEALLAGTAAEEADLLVMGGYGHSRLLEIVTGGTTRAVLRHMHIPVFLSH